MSIKKPYHRNYRSIVDGSNSGYSDWAYIIDKEYSKNPSHYTRAFLIIQKDLQELIEFIEPSDINLKTYSFRIHQLLIRACIEIEANFKAILRENIYNPLYQSGKKCGKPRLESEWNIKDYQIVNKTHHLDSYKVGIPIWNEREKIFRPFESWKNDEPLIWYQAYNKSKHDRMDHFADANFENLLMAISGLFVLLSSQFKTESFSPGTPSLSVGRGYSYYDGEFGIGDFFTIYFPNDWDDEEKYDFNWSDLQKENVRFQKIDYDKIT